MEALLLPKFNTLCVLVGKVLADKIHFISGGHVYFHGDVATGVPEIAGGPQLWRSAQIKATKDSWLSVTVHERFKFCSILYIHHWHLEFARRHPAQTKLFQIHVVILPYMEVDSLFAHLNCNPSAS